MDEPTTGLHFEEVERLVGVLNQLVKGGNTVVVIEHNLELIKCADFLVDLGPEAGEQGGRIVAQGTPEEVAQAAGESHTAAFLKPYLTPPGSEKGGLGGNKEGNLHSPNAGV